MSEITLLHGDNRDVLKTLADKSVNTCVTSPPYFGLRDYGEPCQIGLEETPEEYVAALVEVFREVKRVLRDDGTLWLNLGDSYSNDSKWGGSTGGKHVKTLHGATSIGRLKNNTKLPDKNLIGIPWRVAFALQAEGWILRSDIIWSKPNAMPESVTDRPTKSHEYIFLFSKQQKYYYDNEAIREPHARLWTEKNGGSLLGTENRDKAVINGHGRAQRAPALPNPNGANKRSVWTVASQPYSGAHYAVFPEKLIEPCILAGCPEGGTVLDPFGGSGTTGRVAIKNRRNAILIELNPDYHKQIEKRTDGVQVRLF